MMLSRLAALALLLSAAALPAQQSASPETTASPGTSESRMEAEGLYALFYTTAGAFACRLFEDAAPENVSNFVDLACGYRPWEHPRTGEPHREPYYDGTIIYHVARNAMIAGGDPLANGLGSPGYYVQDEISDEHTFDRAGMLAMAHYGEQPDTNSGTWFVTGVAQPNLNGRYTIIGEVVWGMGTVLEISRAAVLGGANQGRPAEDILTERVDIIRVLPNGQVVAHLRSTTRPFAELEHLPLAARAQGDLPLWLRARMETIHRFRLPALPPLPEEESETASPEAN